MCLNDMYPPSPPSSDLSKHLYNLTTFIYLRSHVHDELIGHITYKRTDLRPKANLNTSYPQWVHQNTQNFN